MTNTPTPTKVTAFTTHTAYQVWDPQSESVVGTYATAQRARRRRDTLDLAYGAVRYVVRSVEVTR